MTRPISLGRWSGLQVTMSPLAIFSYLAVAALVALGAGAWRSLSWGEAVIAGLATSLAMFVCESLHQWGHSRAARPVLHSPGTRVREHEARAARRTGYPMLGIHHFSLFSACLYPVDEPRLPPSVHIRRALGGFWINVLIGLLLGAAALWLWPAGGWLGWVTAFCALWNFFVLGLGALLPIRIPGVITVDGATILHYWREGRRGPEQGDTDRRQP